MTAIHYGLNSFLAFLESKSVYWFSDNEAAVNNINYGSRKLELQSIALDIFSVCLHNNISLFPHWIPRDMNETADFVSKLVDCDDWFVSHEFFKMLDALWGPHSADRFANNQNTKLSRFNSLFWTSNCKAVDAFSQNWADKNNWLVPPIFLISTVIRHLLTCKTRGTLVVPAWPSAPFWPLLFTSECMTHIYVIDFRLFHNIDGLLQLGNYKQSLLGSKKFKGQLLAARLDASCLN